MVSLGAFSLKPTACCGRKNKAITVKINQDSEVADSHSFLISFLITRSIKARYLLRCFRHRALIMRPYVTPPVTISHQETAPVAPLPSMLWTSQPQQSRLFWQINRRRWRHHTSFAGWVGGRQGFCGDHSVYPRNTPL